MKKSAAKAAKKAAATATVQKTKAPGAANRNQPPASRAAAYDADQVRPGLKRRGDLTEISWITGTAYVGNGTLGATDSVYFRPASMTSAVIIGAASGDSAHVPVAGADTVLGVSYIRDIAKHYSRMRVHSAKVDLTHIVSSTANDATVALAPVAGPGASDAATTTTGSGTTGASLAAIQSMEGSRTASAYSSTAVDLTRYVRGGSGPKQNEFSISGVGTSTTVIGQADQDGVVPCCFAIGGYNSTTGLRGKDIHNVVVTLVVEFIDFLGVTPLADPVAYLSRQIELHQLALENHLRLLERSSRDVRPVEAETPTCRQLYDLRRRMKSLGLPKSSIPDSAYCRAGCPGCAQREAAVEK